MLTSSEELMHNSRLTRRQVLELGALGVCSSVLLGCEQKELGNAAGDAMITIGTVILRIPHAAGKIIGTLLVSAGTALKITMAVPGGGTAEVTITLTEEQQKLINQALKEGLTVKVTQSDGTKGTVPVTKK
ncbi:MAG: hypothetical protein K2R98_05900 [Gemmataceae bacterium]|nr:hypothetical protein [Gemmataceae bacterium]